jgi:hypothetical protein
MNKLAGLILVVTSYKRAYNRCGFKGKLLNINICGQQTISQLIISNQLSFNCSNNSTKNKGYLMLKLVIIVFKT